MILDVNTGALIKYTDRLERMRNSLLPKAVRNTLNDIAFETKKIVPLVANENFIVRNKGIFKAFIMVNKVSSTDINSMRSEVGILNRNKLAEGLAKQEVGGVSQRGLIQMDTARISNSLQRKVKSANYLNKINLPKTKKKGSGTGFVMIQKGGKGTIFKTSGKKKQKLIPVYSFMKNRRIQIKRKPFIREAAERKSKRIDFIFIKNAEYLIMKNK